MKNLGIILTVLIQYSHSLLAQNLVPNPSFENITSCPTGTGTIWLASPWDNANGGNCDLMHFCQNNNVGYPGSGQIGAHCGDGFARFICYYPYSPSGSPRPNWREYLQVQLSSPLVAGQVYDVSLWYVRGDCLASMDKLGIYLAGPAQPTQWGTWYFGYNIPAGTGHNAPASVTPQIETPAGVPLEDKFNWAQLSGTYTAVGGEQWITIGQFHKDVDLTITGLVNNTAIYYIDDVCVVPTGQDCGSCIVPLPITLANFTASCEDNVTLISWSTASEVNNDYFTIEKSSDGVLFESIGIVDGAGNSNNLLNYSFRDNEQTPETSYYRVKQTDFDGQFTYSPIRSANCYTENDVNIYPNPFSNSFTIDVSAGFSGPIEISIVDNTGRLVYNQTTNPKSEQVQLSVGGELSPGVYAITVKLGEEYQVKKISKIN